MLIPLGIYLCPHTHKDNYFMSYFIDDALHVTVLMSQCLLKQYLHVDSIVYTDNVLRITSHTVVEKRNSPRTSPNVPLNITMLDSLNTLHTYMVINIKL